MSRILKIFACAFLFFVNFIVHSCDNGGGYISKPSNFWIHRCNHNDMLRTFYDSYTGFEMDIIFHEDGAHQYQFENSHDVDTSGWYSLESQFAILKELGFGKSKKGVWLDYKNLNSGNVQKSLEVLNSLLEKYGFEEKKSDFRVESGNWSLLRSFHEAGFKTSYYFPYYDFSSMSAAEVQDAKDVLREALDSGFVDTVSFDFSYYDFILKNTKSSDRLMTWAIGVNWESVATAESYSALRKDDRMEVILVTDKYWR